MTSPLHFALAILSFAVLLLGSSWAQEEQQLPTSETSLYVIVVDGKYGFMDRTGEVVLKPQFQHAYQFTDGLAAVQVEDLWGYIEPTGEFAIEPRFASAGLFSEGLASVRESSYREPWKYIDRTGKVVIEGGFDIAGAFKNGVARVGIEERSVVNFIRNVTDVGAKCEYHFIDPTGKKVPEPAPNDYATGIDGELLLFRRDGLFGYVNAENEVIIEPQFADAGPFVDGRARARQGELTGYIDRTGQFVIPPKFLYANDFAEGLAGVSMGDAGWGCIGADGETVIEPNFNWIYGGFEQGIVKVAVNGKLGYIDQTGKWIWKPSI